jgi:hypothetical protein
MPQADLVCQQCHRPFRTRVKADRPRRFCSRACRDAARRTKVTLVCVQCDRSFLRKAYQRDWSTERGPFCSMRCYGKWQREHTGGEANPNWVAQSSARYGGQWERNRLAALERDGHRCVECGSPRFLHVHHRVPWEPGQTDPHALDNLVTLCAGHHRAAHRALGGW